MKRIAILLLLSALPALAQINNGGGGTSVNVNGSSVSSPNFNATTPAAAAGKQNVDFQVSSSSVSAEIPFPTTCRTMVVGAENGAVLLDADLGPQRKQILMQTAATINEIDVAADGGTPNVIVAKRVCTASPCVTGANETVTNLLSGALATAANGGTACAKTGATAGIDGQTTCSATLQNNTSITAGTYLELVSGTAGGTAKRVSISVCWTPTGN